MKTPSYPSGHSVQGMLIGNVLSDKYPRSRKALMATAKNISYSRRVARAHYKSDSKMGEELGNSMYKHCLLYTSPSPRDGLLSRMPSSA